VEGGERGGREGDRVRSAGESRRGEVWGDVEGERGGGGGEEGEMAGGGSKRKCGRGGKRGGDRKSVSREREGGRRRSYR